MSRLPTIFLRLLTIVSTVCLGPFARAGEIYEFYNGARPLGMGGAYVTTVNDETSLYSNPAALGRLRDPFFTLVDPEVAISSKFTDTVGFGNLTDVFAAQGLLDALNASKGKHFHTRFQITPSIALPNFAVGGIAKYTIDGEVDEAGNDFRLDYTNDFGVAVGYSFRFWDGIIKLGFNGKFINRVEVHQSVPATSTDLKLKDIAAEGGGISTDIGLLITAPVQFLPIFGIVVRDVGHTKFNLTDGAVIGTEDRRPGIQNQKMDVGFSFSPIVGKRARYVLTAEVHDVMTKDEEEGKNIMRRLHAGGEVNISDFFFVRAGLNQHYWTAGFEFASERFQLQAASYGEDIGAPGTPREDRRFVGKFSLRF